MTLRVRGQLQCPAVVTTYDDGEFSEVTNCIRPINHRGDHRDVTGDTWRDKQWRAKDASDRYSKLIDLLIEARNALSSGDQRLKSKTLRRIDRALSLGSKP